MEDAIQQIYYGNVNMHSQFRIQFFDSDFKPEDGIDGGGLLKEFLLKITETIFSPENAFFEETSNHELHPKYQSREIDGFANLFEFFGMIVGKAIYEGNLLNLNFARYFLNKMVRKHNQVDDLQALDAELYLNLMKMKYYEGDVSDFCLSMSVSEKR